MKPAAFEYLRPTSLDEALEALHRHRDDAKILAGGQSLVPLLNFRMLRPAMLIDINGLEELQVLRVDDGGALRIGALTRHVTLETSALVRERFPVLGEAVRHVAHLAIRNRGTIGGSLCHADPAAELPMMMVLLDARLHTRSTAGSRVHPAEEFFEGPLMSAIEEDEILTGIEVPPLPAGAGWAFEEFSQRSGDFAIAAVAAIVELREGTVAEMRLAAMGVGPTPLRLHAVEEALVGQPLTEAAIRDAAAHARQEVDPETDLKASADYRRHLVEALTERCLEVAGARAAGTPAAAGVDA
ncbi:xanthine dehydrogenase family protein subunit M [Microbaculum marinum]|uniref:Xanthine dehydrogenase family protein subunit M n=1 Tax=Microbaculum marinum TaxID=1764581 RepID=A0AAW9RYF7_9HYPH